MKTAVTVLQEMMIKLGQVPEYEFVAQAGPMHQATFEYRCSALGVSVAAMARSKKDAKQEVARLLLAQLGRRGHAVPAPFHLAHLEPPLHGPTSTSSDTNTTTNQGAEEREGAGSSGGVDARSYVAVLKELCEEFHLPGAQYDLVGDTGPPHLRHFTMSARIDKYCQCATATTKKAARQRAAELLYRYLRDNLHRVLDNFNEEDALVRAHERAMDRFKDVREEPTWRPDLGLKVSQYHLGLVLQLEESARVQGLQVLEETRDQPPEGALDAVVQALGLRVKRFSLETQDGGELAVVALEQTSPELMLAGSSPAEASNVALRYLNTALRQEPPEPSPTRAPASAE